MQEKILKSLSIDCVIFGYEDGELKVLLIRRKQDPEKGSWALPGGFVLEKENLDDSAQRILHELTGMKQIFMEQVKAFGQVDRYPIRRVVTIAYYALIKPVIYELKAGSLAEDAKWFSLNNLPGLPFDHKLILEETCHLIRRKVRNEPIGFELLPDKFSLTELQQLYQAILNKELDKRNFRKKLLKMNLLVALEETQKGVSHRAARLYKFDQRIYNKLKEKGFTFEL